MAFTGAGGHPAIAAASDRLLSSPDSETGGARAPTLTPRQQELDRRWAYYRCSQYDSCKVSWDGSLVVGQVEKAGISMQGFVPPGFYVANHDTLPIQFRKPTSQYPMVKVIVDRFTSLLFGQKRHPKVNVRGDADTEDYVNAVIDEGRLWAQMALARGFGGATGTAVVGFKVINGHPQFEVFDPRWCTPTFFDRAAMLLKSIEYRYMFKQEVVNPEDGNWVEVDMWYRRVIDMRQDVIFEPILADPRTPPIWVPASSVQHGLGFCPVVWIQNEPNLTDIDGDPDCLGVYDKCDTIDRLQSQSDKGVIANCDPTVVVATDAQMADVRKGSSNALKLPGTGTATYMEMNGGGIEQARQQVQMHKDEVLEVTQCVLEQPAKPQTATEVDRNYAAMLARADKFREQYGELGIKRLINMVIVTAKKLGTPRPVNGSITRYQILLPKKKDGTDRVLGPGPYNAVLTWPQYFEPSIDDAVKATQAAGQAKQVGLIDQEHATKFVAPFFQVEDHSALARKIEDAQRASQDQLDQMALGGAPPDDAEDTSPEPEKPADTAFNGAQVQALAQLVEDVASGKLPVEAAHEIILVAFPVTDDQAARMLAGLKGRVPAPAAVAAPPASSPPPPPPGTQPSTTPPAGSR